MRRTVVPYGLVLAGLLLALKMLEGMYYVQGLPMEYLIGSIALLFILLGIWVGWKFRPITTVTVASAPTVVTDTTVKDTGAPRELVQPAALGISPREEEVLRLIAAGHSNQEIADKLFLSLNTIKKHTGSLFRKLEAERRTQAIEKARQMGLLS